MIKNQDDLINKIHLIISALIVIPVAIIYGFQPDLKFDIYLDTIDEFNFFKAIMGLYLGFSILWILGLFRTSFYRTALITNIVFMLGLGFGRLLSLLLDGAPTLSFLFGTIGELLLGIYGLWVLKRNSSPKAL